MKKSFLVLFISLLAFQSCVYINDPDDIPARGENTRTYDFRNFDQLQMGDSFHVKVKAGSSFEVSATGELNDLDDLEIFVQQGKLVARYRNSSRHRRRMDIDVTMPSIAAVDFSGAVNAVIDGFENVSKLEFELSGASECEFSGSGKTLYFDLSGASQMFLSGTGKYLDGELSGASEIDAFNFPVEESDIKLVGASEAKVWASKLLEVDASGASSVRYKGNPVIDKQLSGGSLLRKE